MGERSKTRQRSSSFEEPDTDCSAREEVAEAKTVSPSEAAARPTAATPRNEENECKAKEAACAGEYREKVKEPREREGTVRGHEARFRDRSCRIPSQALGSDSRRCSPAAAKHEAAAARALKIETGELERSRSPSDLRGLSVSRSPLRREGPPWAKWVADEILWLEQMGSNKACLSCYMSYVLPFLDKEAGDCKQLEAISKDCRCDSVPMQ